VYNRGVAHFRKGEPDRALADFGEAIRLDPGFAKAYLARGVVHARKGDDARARADRQKAAELDPSLAQVAGPGL
jgi:Flp pilus assembly protein TadD